MYTGRYQGRVANVSTKGDWGFVERETIAPAYGHDGTIPTDKVFIHVRKTLVDRLKNRMWVSFEIKPSKTHQGKFAASEVLVIPRLVGRLRLIRGKTGFGFIDPQTISLAPDEEWGPEGLDTADLTDHSVFVHFRASFGGPTVLVPDMHLSFVALRSRDPEREGKYQAVDATILQFAEA
jgi:hypothetical protein